jgi:DNA-directed RNA polymerase specialized sigma24 family protein
MKRFVEFLPDLKRINPAFVEAVQDNPLAGTPLQESVIEQPTMTPPRVQKYSITQRSSWQALQASLSNRQEQVLIAIDTKEPCTAKQICDFLGLPINSVTGRISELRDELGLIVEFDTEVDPSTNRPCVRYAIKTFCAQTTQ